MSDNTDMSLETRNLISEFRELHLGEIPGTYLGNFHYWCNEEIPLKVAKAVLLNIDPDDSEYIPSPFDLAALYNASYMTDDPADEETILQVLALRDVLEESSQYDDGRGLFAEALGIPIENVVLYGDEITDNTQLLVNSFMEKSERNSYLKYEIIVRVPETEDLFVNTARVNNIYKNWEEKGIMPSDEDMVFLEDCWTSSEIELLGTAKASAALVLAETVSKSKYLSQEFGNVFKATIPFVLFWRSHQEVLENPGKPLEDFEYWTKTEIPLYIAKSILSRMNPEDREREGRLLSPLELAILYNASYMRDDVEKDVQEEINRLRTLFINKAPKSRENKKGSDIKDLFAACLGIGEEEIVMYEDLIMPDTKLVLNRSKIADKSNSYLKYYVSIRTEENEAYFYNTGKLNGIYYNDFYDNEDTFQFSEKEIEFLEKCSQEPVNKFVLELLQDVLARTGKEL